LLFLHNLFGSQNLTIIVEILLLNLLNPFLIFLSQHVKFLIIHFTHCAPIVRFVRFYALGIEIWPNSLGFEFLLTRDILHLNNS